MFINYSAAVWWPRMVFVFAIQIDCFFSANINVRILTQFKSLNNSKLKTQNDVLERNWKNNHQKVNRKYAYIEYSFWNLCDFHAVQMQLSDNHCLWLEQSIYQCYDRQCNECQTNQKKKYNMKMWKSLILNQQMLFVWSNTQFSDEVIWIFFDGTCIETAVETGLHSF